ncbi:MAG: lipopolysaccharide heptosyltransferase II [Gemmatimonadaceae bacterium]|nr:lipopolysaccharide heptosyltransferase II [Gemmatimonadaceae bacterium]
MPSLVVQTSFLGDVILTTPLIAELSRRGPVDVLTTPIGRTVLANDPAIRKLIVFDKKTSGRLIQTWKVVRSLRDSDSEIRESTAFMAQGSMRSAAVAAFAGIPVRIGFDTSAGKPFYTRTVEYQSDRHHAERLLRLADVENPDLSMVRPRLYPGGSDKRSVDRLMQGQSTPFVVLAPGSAWGTKRWPYFPQLARILTENFPVVVIGGDAEGALAGEIEVAAPGRTIDATGELSVLGSAELIGRAAAIVSNDSAPLHLASAMNTPTVAVFGPTVPDFGFGPLSDARQIAGLDGLPCRPCDRHGPQSCPLGHWRCMRELSAEYVYELLMILVPLPRMA